MKPRDQYIEILSRYLPKGSVETIADWILKYDFDMKITRERATKLGDFRSGINGQRAMITVNHSLNQYNFLITLVHEVAHLTAYEKNKRRIKPHGIEWKNEYKRLMSPFLKADIFPHDVRTALEDYMLDPAASSCTDENLLRVLKKHDKKKDYIFLEELPVNAVFKTTNERYFVKGEKLRKRFKCKELHTRRFYLFNPLAEVILVKEELFS